MLVGIFDVIEGRAYLAEIDPNDRRVLKRLPGKVPESVPMLDSWPPGGPLMLRYWGVAKAFEKEALAAFKSAVKATK